MDTPKTKITTIDDYIASQPEDVRAILEELRQTIKQAAPGADEAISYQMPTFKLHGNLVHFAVNKNHIGFYPAPSGIEAFKQELAPYGLSKGAIRFPKDQPLPLDLVRRIVEHRVQENIAKHENKKR